MVKKLDHLDGLKYAIEIIEDVENHYKAMGVIYMLDNHNPFHDIQNKIRMLLGLPLNRRRS